MVTKTTATSLAAAAALALAPAAQAAELHRDIEASQVVDLTHEMHADMTFWPGGIAFDKTKVLDYGDYGYRLHKFTVGENTGTHADAPSHMVRGAAMLDEIPAKDLILPAVVIDVQDEAAANADYRLSAERVRAWEDEHGRIPENALVIMNTGWHEKFDSQNAYANQDDEGTLHFPGYGKSAANLLVKRNVAAVATDTLSIDAGEASDFPAHNTFFDAGVWGMENLTNLDKLPATGATVVTGVLPVRDGTQAQARVFALIP
jgi:kynurenine formamidase